MAQSVRFPGVFLDGEALKTRAPKRTATARHIPNRKTIYDSEFAFKAALHNLVRNKGAHTIKHE